MIPLQRGSRRIRSVSLIEQLVEFRGAYHPNVTDHRRLWSPNRRPFAPEYRLNAQRTQPEALVMPTRSNHWFPADGIFPKQRKGWLIWLFRGCKSPPMRSRCTATLYCQSRRHITPLRLFFGSAGDSTYSGTERSGRASSHLCPLPTKRSYRRCYVPRNRPLLRGAQERTLRSSTYPRRRVQG
jgi:hypothetical protein